jgi:hypothetical protein
MMQTDVKAISLAASGAIFGDRTRVRGLIIEPGGSAGGETFSVLIPAEGVLCLTSAYATLSNAKVTVFYG